MLALGVAGGTAFQGWGKAFKGSSSSFDGVCPSTPVSFGVACGMRISTVAAASCDDVLAEINARINGQGSVWHDPHNNGTYTKCVNPIETLPTLTFFVISRGPTPCLYCRRQSYGGSYSASRRTGDGKYTDKMIFTLTPTAGASSSSCKLEACSRSQVFSLLDMGTNYCNLKMLFCGSKDGCKPVAHDFTVAPELTESFQQSNVDLSACLKV